MKRTFALVVILNLLCSVIGVAQFAHYCGDEKELGYFSSPGCGCEDDGGCDCCKDEVTVVQLNQDGISAEKCSSLKPTLSPSLFNVGYDIHTRVSDLENVQAFISNVDVNYGSPPIYLVNRLLLI